MHPLSIDKPSRKAIAAAALSGVIHAASRPGTGGDARFRVARAHAFRALKASGTAPQLKAAAAALLDVAEQAAGELAEAGITAAAKACSCDETGLRILRALIEVGIQAAFEGLRTATPL